MCVVCQEPLGDGHSSVWQLDCRHQFHKQCLIPWATSHTTCPTCRTDIATQYNPVPPGERRTHAEGYSDDGGSDAEGGGEGAALRPRDYFLRALAAAAFHAVPNPAAYPSSTLHHPAFTAFGTVPEVGAWFAPAPTAQWEMAHRDEDAERRRARARARSWSWS